MPPRVASSFTHYRACNLCEAICGLEIRIEDGEIVSIRGDVEDPLSRGHICPKAVALQDIHADPDRLRRPLLREGAEWRELGWEQAFDLAASRLRQLRREHGQEATALYLGNPNVHNYGSLLYGPLFIKALRPRYRYSATSVDQLPHHLAAYFMFGHQLLLPVPDIERTDFFLIMGGNPAVSNGSMMTAPDIKKRLREIRDRGGRVVTVDPRRTETAQMADRHYFVRPGSDALLLAALIRTILDEGLASPGRLGQFTDGLDRIAEILAPFPPEAVGAVVGLEAREIRALARDFAGAPSAVAYGRLGLSVQEFGGLCQWLVNVLNLVSGNLDRVGGAMFPRAAIDLPTLRRPGSFGRFGSRVRGLPEFAGELPVATMAEDMLTDGEGRIRALVTVAGNPVLSTPNGRQLDRALGGLDFMLSIDFYLNETTRHADLILPPTAALEHDHYDLVFHHLAIRNTARYSPPLFDAGADARHDWEIYLELARRLQEGTLMERLKAGATRAWMRRLQPAGVLDRLLARGPYGRRARLRRLRDAPHGVDLGPLVPCLPERLFTPDKRIRLVPELFANDVERLERRLEALKAAGTEGRLLLIGRRQVRSNNSWMHNYPRLMKGKSRCTLLVHPVDAERVGLRDGGRAVVRSRVGSVEALVDVSDEIMPGVVSLPHGWGHQRGDVRLETASRQPGVSLNDLTDHRLTDALSGNAALSGVPVEVAAAAPADPSETESR